MHEFDDVLMRSILNQVKEFLEVLQRNIFVK